MGDTVYYLICVLLSVGVLLGIRWMSRVETAVRGNRFSALCMLMAVVVTLLRNRIFSDAMVLAGLALGAVVGLILTDRVRMIAMPQAVGLLNGLGGAASAIASYLAVAPGAGLPDAFQSTARMVAIAVGGLTFSGSIVAAAKLQGLARQEPIVLRGHSLLAGALFVLMAASVVMAAFVPGDAAAMLGLVASLAFGVVFAIRVGGADMPITISLLNSTSGVAAAIAGMAVGDILLVAIGSVVGASGLLLTRIMCTAMNRSLVGILFAAGHGHAPTPITDHASHAAEDRRDHEGQAPVLSAQPGDLAAWVAEAQSVVIIPGYGMAAAQAQSHVRQLSDRLMEMGKTVRFAIHPVAGRMPGHMNVLLAEADIPYDLLFEMEAINDDLAGTDLMIAVGANDVINPAANTAVGTPIYGMPVLAAERAKKLVICNFDLKPGYAGVANPLYEPSPDVLVLLGDAKDSLQTILNRIQTPGG